jgi:hypothetical protein
MGDRSRKAIDRRSLRSHLRVPDARTLKSCAGLCNKIGLIFLSKPGLVLPSAAEIDRMRGPSCALSVTAYHHIEQSMYSASSIKVLRLRLKDKHAKLLRDLAGEVNFVWNYCNELQIQKPVNAGQVRHPRRNTCGPLRSHTRLRLSARSATVSCLSTAQFLPSAAGWRRSGRLFWQSSSSTAP